MVKHLLTEGWEWEGNSLDLVPKWDIKPIEAFSVLTPMAVQNKLHVQLDHANSNSATVFWFLHYFDLETIFIWFALWLSLFQSLLLLRVLKTFIYKIKLFHLTCWYLSLRPDTKSFVLRGILVWVTRIISWGILR